VAASIVAWPKNPTQNENQGGPQNENENQAENQGGTTAPQLSEDFTGESLTSLEAQGWHTWSKTQMPEVLGDYQGSLSGVVSVENGALKATGAGGFIYSANWSDYTLSFKFKTNISPGYSWCGLAFRGDNAWTSESWPQNAYILQLGYFGSNNGLWKIVSGSWTQIASSDNFGLNVNPELSNLWHDVRLEAQGSSLKVYVDDQLLLSATDGSLTSGSVGLLNYDGPVYFDNVTVS
jgi:hypothetical protein